MTKASLEKGTELFLNDIKEEFMEASDGNFEMVIEWDEVTNKAKIFRLIPDENDCSSSATEWKKLDEVTYTPILILVTSVTAAVRFNDKLKAEIHMEASQTGGRAIYYFPEK